jgi:hypothetical protein
MPPSRICDKTQNAKVRECRQMSRSDTLSYKYLTQNYITFIFLRRSQPFVAIIELTFITGHDLQLHRLGEAAQKTHSLAFSAFEIQIKMRKSC